jgi:SAM-dependent methyltransferase
MKKEFEKIYHDLEKEHFWFKARRSYILQIVKKLSKNKSILDIGCSTGVLLNDLKNIGFCEKNLYGIDISQKAITSCKNSGIRNAFVMDGQEITLNKKMDVIIASDCLEHIKEDTKALENWYSLLKDGGLLIVFVPAYKTLWSEHDEVNMHFRRYTRRELRDKLLKTGFLVIKASYWNFFLFFPVLLMRMLSRIFNKKGKRKNTGDLQGVGMFNGVLYKLLIIENVVLNYINLPLGVSVFCLGKKKSNN